MGSSFWRPVSGRSSSRNIRWPSCLISRAPNLRDSSAMRSKWVGKCLRIMFQYPAPPLGQPMQLLLSKPSWYMAGSSIPAARTIAWQSAFLRPASIRGNDTASSKLFRRKVSARRCSSIVKPKTCMSSGFWKANRTAFFNSPVQGAPWLPAIYRRFSHTSQVVRPSGSCNVINSLPYQRSQSAVNRALSGCSVGRWMRATMAVGTRLSVNAQATAEASPHENQATVRGMSMFT